ncbi:hypothetical protein [Streptomyces indicus]|uniref:Adenylylsulfate kinase n=1 Tax=Streptomyces indicus TaxID=417292 RepID=A0A1G8TXF7_9ACTN|nr:hypothetical protein [Streptomyces indicus]SDJ46248.1 hypothetical protein SAMN05421806_101516 [Streptomyces indicus]
MNAAAAPGPPTPSALLLTGTVGVGKTSVADELGDRLATAGVPHGVIDLDRLSQAWPAPADDPFNAALMLRNLKAVAANYLAAGARHLVLAGVAEDETDRGRLADALGVPLAVCRLTVQLPVVHERLRHRHEDRPDDLAWHLKRSGELAAILDRARVEDFTVDATHAPVGEVADVVLAGAGWLAR